MTVIPLPNGGFAVADETGKPIAWPFESNADAWRWIDRHDGEPISRSEKTAEWVFQKMADGGAA